MVTARSRGEELLAGRSLHRARPSQLPTPACVTGAPRRRSCGSCLLPRASCPSPLASCYSLASMLALHLVVASIVWCRSSMLHKSTGSRCSTSMLRARRFTTVLSDKETKRQRESDSSKERDKERARAACFYAIPCMRLRQRESDSSMLLCCYASMQHGGRTWR